MFTLKEKIFSQQEIIYDFNIANLLLLCVNQFIHLFISELLPLSFYCFNESYMKYKEY